MTPAQDHPGLDAAGFLLLAEGHLLKAKELLSAPRTSVRKAMVLGTLNFVVPAVRNAMRLLNQEKEETCKL